MNMQAQREDDPSIIKERLSIEVTTRCNIDCSYCFARAGKTEFSELSLDLARDIITEGYHTGYRHLHLTGGEPILWGGLFDALDGAFDVGYQSVFLNTNGTIFTKDVINRLSTYNGLRISVSLEGMEAAHDHLRGDGSYIRAVRGIESALDCGIEISIFTTVFLSSLPELTNFADHLYSKFPDISCLILIQLVPLNNGVFPLAEELLEPKEFLELIDAVSLLNLFGFRTCILNNPLAYVSSKLLKILWVPYSTHLYSDGSMIVMANKDIRLSHSTRSSFGKYEVGVLETVLASEAYQKAVAPDQVVCPSCKYMNICRENGMVRPTEWYFDTQENFPYCKNVLDCIGV